MLKAVCLSGVARAGKDFFYKLINQKYPDLFVPFAIDAQTLLKRGIQRIRD